MIAATRDGKPTLANVARWTAVLIGHGGAVEVRSLGTQKKESRVFAPGTDPLEIARHALVWGEMGAKVYLTMNPVRPGHPATKAASDGDIVARHWLLIDVDPARPADTSATDEEKRRARLVIDAIRDELCRRGWPESVLADSGNGLHLLYRVDLPNDENAKALVKAILTSLARRFDTPDVRVDTSVCNASRITKFYGTTARKGECTPERPHRPSALLEVPVALEAVPSHLLAELAREMAPSPSPTKSLGRGIVARRGDGPDPIERATHYLRTMDIAISGDRGSVPTFRAACEMNRFGLSEEQALRLLLEEYNPRCRPPWSVAELRHKVEDAYRKHPDEHGSRLAAGRLDHAAPNGAATAVQVAALPPWPPLRLHDPRPVPTFPVDALPALLRPYCNEVAQAKLAPVDFVGCAMLAVASAAIGQSVNLRVKRDWVEAPLLYMILVGTPGKGKSPVTHEVARPLNAIDRRLRQASQEEHRRWQAEKKQDCSNDREPPAEPPHRRAVVRDITRESLVLVMQDNPRGVLCDPDEASGWVASFNEYKGGKGGADRQFWLTLWSARTLTVDRKGGRESTYVPSPFATVLGGIQPALLGAFHEERGRDDGLFDRLLFCNPDAGAFPPQRWTEMELSEDAEAQWTRAVERLHETPMTVRDGEYHPRVVDFTDAGKREWVAWFDAHAAEAEASDFADRHGGLWSKLRAYAARLALILSCLRRAVDPAGLTPGDEHPGPIDAEDVRGAVALVDYFKAHALRVRHEIGGGFDGEDARAILAWIRRKRIATFRLADVAADLRRFRENPAPLERALRCLERAGAVRPRVEPYERGRRPTPAYEVHPTLFELPENPENAGNDARRPPAEAVPGISGICGRARNNGSDAPPNEPVTASNPGRGVFEL
jgi:hypothetical protein